MRFTVKKSTIAEAGHGLFTQSAIQRGIRFEITGLLVLKGSNADRYTHYADAYKFRVGRHLLIPTGHGGLVNHSARPNLKKVIKGRTVWLEALRPIAAGEELFFRYSDYAVRRFLSGKKKRGQNAGRKAQR